MLESTLSLLWSVMPFEVFEPRFMRMALLGLILLAPTAATIGVHVINHRLSFFSDAIGHSAFSGVALGILFSLSPRLTMPIFAVLVGVLIMWLQRRKRLASDTAIGVVFSGIVAFGLAIVSREPSLTRSLQQFLYGDILTIEDSSIYLLLLIFFINIVFQWIGYNSLLFSGLNTSLAAAHGTSVSRWHYSLSVLISLVVIFSVWAVGVLLVTALLIVPAAAARNLSRSAGVLFWWALLIGITSAVAGLWISSQEWAGIATGSAVVLFSIAWFVMSLLVGRGRFVGRLSIFGVSNEG